MKIRRNHHHAGAPGSDGDLLVGAGHGSEDGGPEAEDHAAEAVGATKVDDAASGTGKGAPPAGSGDSKADKEKGAAAPTSQPRGLLGEVLVARGLVTLE